MQLYGRLAVINLIATLVFAAMALVVPRFSELSTRVAVTDLDPIGAINVGALDPKDPRYAFNSVANLDYRRNVPIFISAAPLNAERGIAILGAAIGLINTIVLGAAWRTGKPRT